MRGSLGVEEHCCLGHDLPVVCNYWEIENRRMRFLSMGVRPNKTVGQPCAVATPNRSSQETIFHLLTPEQASKKLAASLIQKRHVNY